MTRRLDELDGPVAELVAELVTWRTAPAPAPGAALRDLFAQAAAVTPPATVTPRRTPVSEPKRPLAALPAKIAAGVVGALLAGSLGAGAMTGTITLTSNDSDAPAEVEAGELEFDEKDPEAEENDLEAEEKDLEVVEPEEKDLEVDDVEDVKEPKDGGDPTTAPVPTSVEEAAQNHQFDDACGNHGAYVSHFARTGEEPECATAARGGASVAAAAPVAGDDEVTASSGKTNASATGVEKSQAGKDRAAANKAKAPGKATAGR